MWLSAAVLAAILTIVVAQEKNAYDPNYGIFVGELSNLADGDISGTVYIVNESTLQVLNFTHNGNAQDLYFWLDHTEKPSTSGLKIPTFEFGVAPIGAYDSQQRVVLQLPGKHKLNSYKSLALYSFKYETNFGSVLMPEDVNYPKPHILGAELKGSRYSVESGPISILDRRTIKVYGFTFDADKAPDGYFFVGRGPNVAHDAGVKVPIRGRDSSDSVTAMNERYRGGQDIILELPKGYDIEHIDWLAIYCYKFRVDFGHVAITNVTGRIPPYVPLQHRYDEMTAKIGWRPVTLYGTPNKKNFTFQIGVPGGSQGYQAITGAPPGDYVWYINGVLAKLVLKRGITYNFIVEGGDDRSATNLYNPLYLGSDKQGGYSRLTKEEQDQVKIYSGSDVTEHAGHLCVWLNDDEVNPDSYSSFNEFRRMLRLNCDVDEQAALFKFTPDAKTPDTLYYQSATSFNMGWKIEIVDELPANITEMIEEPYQYDLWLKTRSRSEETASSRIFSSLAILSGLMFALLW